jgi:hypothetical protein
VILKLTPNGSCINPVIELDAAPGELASVALDGRPLEMVKYAWDGRVLWLDAAFSQPVEIALLFKVK